jgi:hypothetical protein
VKLASTLDLLSETGVEDLLASRGRFSGKWIVHRIIAPESVIEFFVRADPLVQKHPARGDGCPQVHLVYFFIKYTEKWVDDSDI